MSVEPSADRNDGTLDEQYHDFHKSKPDVARDAGESAQSAAIQTPPDGGYGWVIVGASFFVHVFVLGNIYSFGVLFPVYMEAFNAPQGSVAWVGSIGGCLMTALAAFSGIYADRYGNGIVIFIGGILVSSGFLLASFSTSLWQLYLTQGVITGVGYSLTFIAGVSVIGQWFTTRRGLAVGIAVAGSGLGQFAVSLCTGALLDKFKWRATLRYLALIDIVGLTLCSVFVRRFAPLVSRSSTESGWVYFQDRNFRLLYVGALLTSMGLFMPYTHLPKYAQLHGVSTQSSIVILSIMGIASSLGRILVGFAADIVGKISMLQVCVIVGGVSTFCWLLCTTFITMVIYGFVFGFFAGGFISLVPTVCAELYGVRKLGTVIGVLYTGTAVGNLLSAPIGGFLFDGTGNYTASIIVAASFLLLSGLMNVFVDKDNKSVASYVDVDGNVVQQSSHVISGVVDEDFYSGPTSRLDSAVDENLKDPEDTLS